MKHIFLLVGIAVLLGCSTSPSFDWNNPAQIKTRIFVTKDDYRNDEWIQGPRYPRDPGRWVDQSSLLRAYRLVPKIGAWTHQLYVTLNYDYYTGGSRHEKPHFYNAAYDSSGVELEFYRRSADVVSVSSGGTINMQEEVIITLPDGYLKEHQAGGLNIKLYGKNGSAVCCIPSAYVMAFLQKLSELETVAP